MLLWRIFYLEEQKAEINLVIAPLTLDFRDVFLSSRK